MSLIRILTVVTSLLVLVGCKVEISALEGGTVSTQSGNYACAAGKVCVIDVVDLLFDETFIAQPIQGYEFVEWRKQPKALCGGNTAPCRLSTTAFGGAPALISVLESDTVFFLEPVFEKSSDGVGAVQFSDPLLAACVSVEAAKRGWQTAAEVTQLNCANSDIKLLGGLEAFPNLKTLNLRGNDLRDIAPLGALLQIETLNLSSLPGIRNLDPLFLIDGLNEVDLRNSGEGNLQCSSLDALARAVKTVRVNTDCKTQIANLTFPDVALQNCVLSKAGQNALIYASDLTELDCEESGVTRLDGLEKIENLQSLNIIGNEVSDLGPISQLVNLEYVFVSDNPIVDLSPLNALPKIKVLGLRQIPGLTGIDTLAAVGTLEEVSLGESGDGAIPCASLDALAAQLTSLDRPLHCQILIRDIVFEDPVLRNCVVEKARSAGLAFSDELNNLLCNDLGITSLVGLEQFSEVVALTLRDNEIRDLSPLSGLRKLRGLLIDGNRLLDFDGISALEELRIIDASRNPELTSISTLRYMGNLFDLHLTGSGASGEILCEDLDALSQTLKTLDRPASCDDGKIAVDPGDNPGEPPAEPPNQAVTDINNDGRADIVMETRERNGASAWRVGQAFLDVRPGESSLDQFGYRFAAPLVVDPANYSHFEAIAIADANGDGRDDVLFQMDSLVDGFRYLSVFTVDAGALTTEIGRVVLRSGDDARGIAFTDINGDGYADILYQKQVRGLISYHMSLATGNAYAQPVQVRNFDPSLGTPELIALEDVNNDGTADLVYDRVLGNRHCFFVSVFRNGGFERQTRSTDCAVVELPFEYNLKGLAVADVTGDGRSELIIGHDVKAIYANIQLAVLEYFTLDEGPSGSRWIDKKKLVDTQPYNGPVKIIAVQDLNNDGRADVLTEVTVGNARTWVAYVAKDYGRYDAQYWLDGKSNYQTVGLRDYNGDGLLDLLVDIPPATGSALYVKFSSGNDFRANAWAVWLSSSQTRRFVGVEEEGLTTLANDTSELLAWVGIPGRRFTHREFEAYLQAKGLELLRGIGPDVDKPIGAQQCKLMYSKVEDKGSRDAVDYSAKFAVAMCNVQIGDRLSVKMQALYGGCRVVAGPGGAGKCEVGAYNQKVKVKLGPPGLPAEIVEAESEVNLLKAETCGGVSPQLTCLKAGADVASTSLKASAFDDTVGVKPGVAIGVGGGADVSIEDGVISGSFEGKFLLGVSFEVSLNYEKTGEFFYKVGESGYVFTENAGSEIVRAAGPAVVGAVNVVGHTGAVLAGQGVYVAEQAVVVFDDLGGSVDGIANDIANGLVGAGEAVGGVVIDVGSGIADGAVGAGRGIASIFN